MPTRYTAKQIAEIAELVRFQRHRNGARPEDIMEFEYRKSDHLSVLKNVRFGRAISGRPTKKTMECMDDGVERSYDGKYDFQVTAFMVAGTPIKKL